MNRRHIVGISMTLASTAFLTACSGGHATPTVSSAPTSASTADVPNNGAPKVENPLPAKVLDGDPCDDALTSGQLSSFLGQTSAPKSSNDPLGASCTWTSASGSSASILVGYQTKSDQGISLAYKNVKPKAARWADLEPVQGYPAAGYVDVGLDSDNKRNCVVVVGVSDELAYSVSLIIGDKAAAQGKDACDLGRGVADAVMTNLRQRA